MGESFFSGTGDFGTTGGESGPGQVDREREFVGFEDVISFSFVTEDPRTLDDERWTHKTQDSVPLVPDRRKNLPRQLYGSTPSAIFNFKFISYVSGRGLNSQRDEQRRTTSLFTTESPTPDTPRVRAPRNRLEVSTGVTKVVHVLEEVGTVVPRARRPFLASRRGLVPDEQKRVGELPEKPSEVRDLLILYEEQLQLR